LRIDQWVNICRENNPGIPIIFIGTKLDLIDTSTLKDEFALRYMQKYDFFNYLKISSKTGENVNLAFELLAKELVKDL
jgi:GTPase SAR1 family protein